MSESKFSPAPWKVSLVDETAVIDASGNQVAQASGDYDAADEWPAMAANARLLAAAPELLGLLTEMVSFFGDRGGPRDALLPSDYQDSPTSLAMELLDSLGVAAK